MGPMRVALVCLLLATSGCRRKSAPEFYQLEKTYSVLVAREGDDAYATAEMAAVVEGLKALPQDALERPRADSLLASILKESARVAELHAPATKPSSLPTAPAPEPMAQPTPQPAPAEEKKEVDAGAPADEPKAGMSEALFLERFGSCFSAGPPLELPKEGAASAHIVKDNPECQKRFGAAGVVTSYVFVKGSLWGKGTDSTATTSSVVSAPDAAVRAPPKPVDAGPPVFVIPGAPMPEGYTVQ